MMRSQACLSIAFQVIDLICRGLFLSTVAAVLWRRYGHGDPFKCESILTDGVWLDPPSADKQSHTSLQNWQPPGCFLKRYTAKDISDCLQGQQIVYIGDSTIRQLYWATTRKIDHERSYQDQHVSEKHSDKSFQKDSFPTINFVWDPYLNSTILANQLYSTNSANNSKALSSSTSIMVVGGGLWHARYLHEDGLQAWEERVEAISNFLDDSRPWEAQLNRPLRLLTPVQVPLYDSLNEDRRRTIKPATIEAMNNRLQELKVIHHLQIPFVFNRMLDRQPSAYEESGLHTSVSTADHMVDVVLNMACNSRLSQERGYPMDMTCCSACAKPHAVQNTLRVALMCGVLALGMANLLSLFACSRSPLQLENPIIRSAGVLAMALMYCYRADRSQLFEKSQKQFDMREMQIYLAVPALLGLLTIKRSSASVKTEDNRARPVGQPMLSRDQTDEWKGWMQIVILAYHYAGGSTVLPIYQTVRILVAAYLFMTGFGHAIFYYKKPDYSLRRVSAVLIRLNLLSVLLPYIMRTDYLFYYFAPLTSFFYITIYITMFIGKGRNNNTPFLVGKIITAALITNLAIRTPAVFERCFEVLAIIFNIHWNVQEWRFRLTLDSYVTFGGMLCGILFLKITSVQNTPSPDHASQSIFEDLLRSRFKTLKLTANFLAGLTIPFYYSFAAASPDKQTYNTYVASVSIFPILAFITLRNSTRGLRNYHSSAFAWIGRISLETFTLQFHIWLAADTKGLLRTGVIDRYYGKHADMLVLTVIFLYVAKKVSDATGRLTGWIVDGGKSIPRGGTVQKEVLPRSKERAAGEGESYKGEARTGLRMLAGKTRDWIASDLRIRLMLTFFSLWVLNWVY